MLTYTKELSVYVLINCFWARGLPWKVVDILSDSQLEEIDFSFPRKYPFQP